MGEQTGISWADHTMNPWIGCERVSPACAHCYADVLASGRMGMPGLWEPDGPRHVTSDSTWKAPFTWNRKAEREGVRRRVFCASMADVFEERDDLEEHRRRLFDVIERTPWLDWLLLTKRPEFASVWLRRFYYDRPEFGRAWSTRDWSEWGVLPNVWVGVSVENQRFTWRADVLRLIPCPVRFISAEPLLGSLLAERGSAERLGPDGDQRSARKPLDLDGIDWLIVGGESGARGGARPMHPEWARELRDAALERRIPLHFKQWGSWVPRPDGTGVLPGDVCLSEDGNRDIATRDYVCFSNESDGTVMRYVGAMAKAGGKTLDGVEWCEIPEPLAVVA